MKPSEYLQMAADLCEKGWTQRVWARDANGNNVNVNWEKAACFCMVGAVWAVTDHVDTNAGCYALEYLDLAIGDTGQRTKYNDAPGRTQGEVVAMLRKAAGLAAKEGR